MARAQGGEHWLIGIVTPGGHKVLGLLDELQPS